MGMRDSDNDLFFGSIFRRGEEGNGGSRIPTNIRVI